MTHSLTLNQEEARELSDLLRREVETTRVELRHTDDSSYRSEVQHRLELHEHLLARLTKARTTPAESYC